jgi:hypothetical protein
MDHAAIDHTGLTGVGGSALVPTVVQTGANGASTTSLATTISAAASGRRLIVVAWSNGRDVNTPTCTNVTFTEVGATNFSTTIYMSVYVGVVSGGSSGTTVTVTATGSNFIFTDVYEVADALTPTAGTSATLTNTNVQAVAYTPVGPITPTKGTFCIFAAAQDNGTTPMPIMVTAPFYARSLIGGSAIFYAPGGSVAGFVTTGTANADFCAIIVPVT